MAHRTKNEERQKEHEQFLREKAEQWARIQALPNEQFTKELIGLLTSDQHKKLVNDKPGFAEHVNNVYAPVPVKA